MKNIHSRKFGKVEVVIDGNTVFIQGETLTNWGRMYPFNFERFNAHPLGADNDWNRPQVMGMEDEVAPAIRNWIYSKIRAGAFDYLPA